jgi:hypothetical protein
MQITLSPIRAAAPIAVERRGATLVIDGTAHDLARYAKGDCPWILGQPRREGGVWQVTLMLPHGGSAPPHTLFPKPLSLSGDGPVPLPPFDTAPDAAAERDADARKGPAAADPDDPDLAVP